MALLSFIPHDLMSILRVEQYLHVEAPYKLYNYDVLIQFQLNSMLLLLIV